MNRDPLNTLYEALNARTGIPFALYAWAKRPENLPTWGQVGLDGEGPSMQGDNVKTDMVCEGTVDVFAREPGAEILRAVQDVFNDLEYAWELYLVLYEQDTRLIHYHWVWRE